MCADRSHVVVFTGPSLHPSAAAALLDATFLPPVKRGDGVQCPDASGEVQPVTLSQSSGRSSG